MILRQIPSIYNHFLTLVSLQEMEEERGTLISMGEKLSTKIGEYEALQQVPKQPRKALSLP
jgi:hypothetical protein